LTAGIAVGAGRQRRTADTWRGAIDPPAAKHPTGLAASPPRSRRAARQRERGSKVEAKFAGGRSRDGGEGWPVHQVGTTAGSMSRALAKLERAGAAQRELSDIDSYRALLRSNAVGRSVAEAYVARTRTTPPRGL